MLRTAPAIHTGAFCWILPGTSYLRRFNFQQHIHVILLGVGYQADHLRDVLRQAERVPLAYHRHPQLPLLLQKSASAHDAWSVQPTSGVHPRGHQGHRGICTSQVILSPKAKPLLGVCESFRSLMPLPTLATDGNLGSQRERESWLCASTRNPGRCVMTIFLVCLVCFAGLLCGTTMWSAQSSQPTCLHHPREALPGLL